MQTLRPPRGLDPNSFQLVQTRRAAFLIGQPNPDFTLGGLLSGLRR
jgi:hypothetical protein